MNQNYQITRCFHVLDMLSGAFEAIEKDFESGIYDSRGESLSRLTYKTQALTDLLDGTVQQFRDKIDVERDRALM